LIGAILLAVVTQFFYKQPDDPSFTIKTKTIAPALEQTIRSSNRLLRQFNYTEFGGKMQIRVIDQTLLQIMILSDDTPISRTELTEEAHHYMLKQLCRVKPFYDLGTLQKSYQMLHNVHLPIAVEVLQYTSNEEVLWSTIFEPQACLTLEDSP
jgi:hypothetical protein